MSINLLDDHWSIVRDLLFEEYATIRLTSSTISYVDLVDDSVRSTTTRVYAVHNAQVRLVCRAFRDFFDAKAAELIWRWEPDDATHIHGRYVRSDVVE